MIKELWQLIKWLFVSNPNYTKELEIVEMKYFPFNGFKAMTWCGRLIVHSKESVDETTKVHETIHLRQAQAIGNWIMFYILYLKEWILGNPFKKPFNSAYYTICFEMEAYANEENKEYVTNYKKENLDKYKISNKKKTYEEIGGTLIKWKKYIKTL